MFDEIVDLESIHKQKCEISERELKLSAPKLKAGMWRKDAERIEGYTE